VLNVAIASLMIFVLGLALGLGMIVPISEFIGGIVELVAVASGVMFVGAVVSE
jgi:hypothetical protein